MQISGQYLSNLQTGILQPNPSSYILRDIGNVENAPAVFTRLLKDGAIIGSCLFLSFAPMNGRNEGEQLYVPYDSKPVYQGISAAKPQPLTSPHSQQALSYGHLQDLVSGLSLLLDQGQSKAWAQDPDSSGILKAGHAQYEYQTFRPLQPVPLES